MLSTETLSELEVGHVYKIKVSSRRRRFTGKLVSKDLSYTGLSLYHGSSSIEVERHVTCWGRRYRVVYTISLHGIESIHPA
jgi:hypothetical protein